MDARKRWDIWFKQNLIWILRLFVSRERAWYTVYPKEYAWMNPDKDLFPGLPSDTKELSVEKAEFIIQLDKEEDLDPESFHDEVWKAEIANFYQGSYTYA